MTRQPIRLSKAVQHQLARIGSDRVVVAAVLTITRDSLDRYQDLGLAFEQGKVTTSHPSPPPRSRGLYARRNLDGWKERRTDLAKEKREISHWAPSWNSGSSHLVSWEVEAYPVEHHPAKLLTISATVLEQLVDGALVRFRVDQPLDKRSANFAEKLRFNLRLLRETIDEAEVFDADLTDKEFARIQQVDWELLPRGSADKVLARLAGLGHVDPVRLKVASERLRVLDRLEHTGFIVGKGWFARYFGAKFGERLVALENLEYGNALYVFEDNWDKLTKLSRTELIRCRDPLVHRLPHLPGWQSAIRQLVRGQ